MEFLQNLFGNLSSGVIRLAVTVGILAAVYFFIVKPVLHTTDNAVNKGYEQIERFNNPALNGRSIEEQVNKSLQEVNKQVKEVNKQVAKEVEKSFHTTKAQGKQEKLLHCVQRAHQNIHRIERCTQRY